MGQPYILCQVQPYQPFVMFLYILMLLTWTSGLVLVLVNASSLQEHKLG